MQRTFQPLFRNAHLATIAGNFWRRPSSESAFSSREKRYQVDAKITIVGFEQVPLGEARAHLVVLHGLEGSAHAGYIQSLSELALRNGYAVHRLNLRTCGGTEALCTTMYHSGLTSDVRSIIDEIVNRTPLPVFLAGYSLGGNVALKLTGEYGQDCPLSGTIAVSAPIDLAQCVKTIDKRSNSIYARRFVTRLKDRIRRKSILSPEQYSSKFLDAVHTIWQFDDQYTARLFGFGNAANYYATQSAINYLGLIRSPTLLVAAKDDPLVPFQIYNHQAVSQNPSVTLLAPQYGGHVGFLSRVQPRFWVDHVALEWIQSLTK